MRKILEIARREYAETVRTKTFILGLLMAPAIMGAILFFGRQASRDGGGPRPARQVAVTDLSGELSGEIPATFEAYNGANPWRRVLLQQAPADPNSIEQVSSRQKARLGREGLDLYVVLDGDVLRGGKMRLYTPAAKATDQDMIEAVKNLLNQAVVTRRCQLRNVSPALLAELRTRVPAEQVEVGASTNQERVQGEADTMARMMMPFFFMFLMFMGIFGMGQHMVTSVIEEKTSRVIEVLLSAVSPLELMAGKIAGLGGIGLTVVGLWGAAAYGAARWKGFHLDIPLVMLAYFALYYVLGFLLLSSILAGIGSICNTIKEAQGLMMPLTLLFVLPMMAWFNIAQHPEGALARVLSFVPPLTPMVMILRLSASRDLSFVEILVSFVWLAASIPVVVWAAAKMFRTGILMYGKRPRLGEILRWVRQS